MPQTEPTETKPEESKITEPKAPESTETKPEESKITEPKAPEPITRNIVPLSVSPSDSEPVTLLPEQPVLDETLGPEDIRIKVSCEVIGRHVVYSKEESDEKFPSAMRPEYRGALSAVFEKCIRTLISVSATRINIALNEPTIEPVKSAKPIRPAFKTPVVPMDAQELTDMANPQPPLPTLPRPARVYPDVFPPPPPPPAESITSK